MVAGLGEQPPFGFMADAGAMGHLPRAAGAVKEKPHHTLLAGISVSGIDRGGSDIVAVADCRHQMVERQRAAADHGLLLGLDEADAAEARAAGNAVCPQVARWIAEKLIPTFR